jgi:hypothetical protein
VTSLRFLTFTFWNYYVLKLICLETITFRDATLSDIKGVLCYVLSQYHNFLELKKERLQGREMTTSTTAFARYNIYFSAYTSFHRCGASFAEGPEGAEMRAFFAISLQSKSRR